jgi:hypothetical protein
MIRKAGPRNTLALLAAVILTTSALQAIPQRDPRKQVFTATALSDFQSGQTYLGFPGNLYENGSNLPPADHEAEGLAFASKVQPLDVQGQPDPQGKIVVLTIGMSNWLYETCAFSQTINCIGTHAFIPETGENPAVNRSTMAIINCAMGGQTAGRWVDDGFNHPYTLCQQTLAAAGLTEAQVQVVLYKNANLDPQVPLSSKTICSPTALEDACQYEFFLGETLRYMKGRYPHLQQVFLHSRIYAGWATTPRNPEPFAYEGGFATQWLIEAQIVQRRIGTIDPTAGDLSFAAAPWIAWGPYFWASGTTPNIYGTTWTLEDYQIADYTHPDSAGVLVVSSLMINWYLQNAFTPWFRASGK